MAITFDTSGKTASSGTATLSYTVGAGAGALMIISISGNSSDVLYSFSAPTYNGATASVLDAFRSDNNLVRVQSWYINNPTQGSANNVSITNSNGGSFEMFVSTYLGTAPITSPNTNGNVDSVGNTSNTVSLTTARDNSWIGTVVATSGGTPSGGTGTTARQTISSGGYGDSNSVIHPAGSASLQWTFGSGHSAMSVFEIPAIQPTATNYRALLGVGI